MIKATHLPAISKHKSILWTDSRDRVSRTNSKPALITENTISWYFEEMVHREEAPAMIYTGGSKFWYSAGVLHREGGPAVEYTNGDTFWYRHGEILSVDSI